MASITSRSAARKTLQSRTVHVKLFPTPINFSERREVLRVLERYGEVVFFKSPKYSPRAQVQDAFFAIYATENAAEELLKQSPLRYRLVSSETPAPPYTNTPAALNTTGSSMTIPEPNPDTPSRPGEISTPFQLEASRTTFNHKLYLRSSLTNPLHGPWVPERENSFSKSLMFSYPTGITSAGMLDWGKRFEDDAWNEKDGHARRKAGYENREVGGVMRADGGLRGLWERGRMERERAQREAGRRERTVMDEAGVEEGEMVEGHANAGFNGEIGRSNEREASAVDGASVSEKALDKATGGSEHNNESQGSAMEQLMAAVKRGEKNK